MGIWTPTSSPCPDAADPLFRPAGFHPAGLSRRRFLEAGGAALAATLFVACDRAGGLPRVTVGAIPRLAPSTTTSTTPPPVGPATEVDILVLSTASSIEHYAAGVYTEAVGLDVVTSPALISAMELFAAHHSEHASAFEAATQQVGGIPYTQPNPELRLAAVHQLGAIRTEADVVRLVYLIEQVAAATYMASVGQFSDLSLNGAIMAVGAIEARHMTVLASLQGLQPPRRPGWPPGSVRPVAGQRVRLPGRCHRPRDGTLRITGGAGPPTTIPSRPGQPTGGPLVAKYLAEEWFDADRGVGRRPTRAAGSLGADELGGDPFTAG